MIEAHEVVPGLWLFRGDASGRNFVVLLGDQVAVAVDPGLSDAVNRFVAEMGGELEAVVLTGGTLGGEAEVAASWPSATLLAPETFRDRTPLPVSLPGWEALPLASSTGSRLALYDAGERVLIAGDLLPEPGVGVPDLGAGVEAYLANLDTLEALDVKLAVTARGEPVAGKRGIKARIENDRNYINSLVRHVGTSLASGVPLDRLLAVAADLYDDFPHIGPHLENMRHVWEELRGESLGIWGEKSL